MIVIFICSQKGELVYFNKTGLGNGEDENVVKVKNESRSTSYTRLECSLIKHCV